MNPLFILILLFSYLRVNGRTLLYYNLSVCQRYLHEKEKLFVPSAGLKQKKSCKK